MGKSVLEITFNENAPVQVNRLVTFTYTINGQSFEIAILWIPFRRFFDSTTGEPAVNISYLETMASVVQKDTAPYTYANYDAINYAKKIQENNLQNHLIVTRNGNTVRVESKVDGLEFSNTTFNGVNNAVTFNITNNQPAVPVSIDKIEYLKYMGGTVSAEDYVLVKVTPSEIAEVTYPIQTQRATVLTFIWAKNQKENLSLFFPNQHSSIATEFHTPPKLSNINLTTSVAGNTITALYVDNSPNFIQTIEFSLDDVNYSSSNVFNVSPGTYTIYVRDNFGDKISTIIAVNIDKLKEPFFHISKLNSFRFKEVQEWDYKNIFKTDENTLSCETLDQVSHKEIQRFQTSDVVKTQYLTNYENVVVKIHSKDAEATLNNQQVLKFQDIKDRRDCVIYPLRNGKTGVYFDVGKIYNYETGQYLKDYKLYGNKPIWMRKGSVIELVGVGFFVIKSVFFSDEKNAEVVEIDYNFNSQATLKQVKSVYSIKNYDAYEFDTDFANFEDKKVRLEILATDSSFKAKRFLSEILDIKNVHENCFEIRYWNDTNLDLLYQTGIKNLLRLPFKKISDNPLAEIEIHKGDTEVSLISSEYYEGDIVEFEPTTKEMSKKLEYALLHSNLLGNRVAYKSSEKPEKEHLEDSNLYVVKAKLIKAGKSMQNNIAFITPEEEVSADIPKLINTGNNTFISY